MSVDDLNQLNKTSADLQQRFDIIKAQHDQMEAEQKASLSKQTFQQLKILNKRKLTLKRN